MEEGGQRAGGRREKGVRASVRANACLRGGQLLHLG